MTLLDKLQTHKGGLLQLKTQLYWYGGRGWDNNPGRICLILDAAASKPTSAALSAFAHFAREGVPGFQRAGGPAAAFLLIDGQPHWVWVAEEDIERL
jgi:hypothetical protein